MSEDLEMKANAQTQVSGDLPMLWQASSTSEVKRVDTSVGGEGKALSRVYSHTKAAQSRLGAAWRWGGQGRATDRQGGGATLPTGGKGGTGI